VHKEEKSLEPYIFSPIPPWPNFLAEIKNYSQIEASGSRWRTIKPGLHNSQTSKG